MPSAYLASGELAYGVPNATEAQIRGASALVDAYLKRPEGLQWNPDSNGDPCYMAGMTPRYTIKAGAAITAGKNVTAPVAYAAGMLSSVSSIGDVVVIDADLADKTEACVIASVAPGAIVLAGVINDHAIGAKMDFGLVIDETRALPRNRMITRVANCPVVRLISGLGSCRTGRRSARIGRDYGEFDLLAMTQPFGPPPWLPFDVSLTGFNQSTGEIWIPSGIMMACYTDARLLYVGGFSKANIPPVVKVATAAAITANLSIADLSGGLKMAKAGDTTIERFANTILDDDTRMQLDGYKAKILV